MLDLLRFNQESVALKTLTAERNQLMEGRINGLKEGWKSKTLIPACYPPHILSAAFRALVLSQTPECTGDFAF